MIAELLPPDVGTAESSVVVSEEVLFPAERALIDQAVAKRRAEFATARHCARRALAEVEIGPAPVLRGSSREPLWPYGIVGSVTHSAGYHAAAVGRITRYGSIGIDCEPHEPLPDGVLDQICLPGERAQLVGIDDQHWDRLLFSAKESVYKTWFPLARRWLGFHDARIALRCDGTFDVQILVHGPIRALRGRWLADDRWIATAIALRVDQSRTNVTDG